MEKTRFPFIEAFGVEGVREPVKLIVQVVAELMEQRAQEGLERDDAPVFCCAHPERDDSRSPSR